MNKVLVILATLAIVALSAFNTYRVEENTKKLVELQQYHLNSDTVDDTLLVISGGLWDTIEEAIQYRKDDIEWINYLEKWRTIPEISLRHILTYHGLHLDIDQIVDIYESNAAYYKAYEKGYLEGIKMDPAPEQLQPLKALQPSKETIHPDSIS